MRSKLAAARRKDDISILPIQSAVEATQPDGSVRLVLLARLRLDVRLTATRAHPLGPSLLASD
jgi:hypothetical protein